MNTTTWLSIDAGAMLAALNPVARSLADKPPVEWQDLHKPLDGLERRDAYTPVGSSC